MTFRSNTGMGEHESNNDNAEPSAGSATIASLTEEQSGFYSAAAVIAPPPLPLPQLKIASGLMMAHACRFPAGSDFSSSLRQMAWQTGAHCVLTIVGSLSAVTLRMPQHRTDGRLPLFCLVDVPLEIVSATGTFAREDNDTINDDGDNDDDNNHGDQQMKINFHIHLSVSDSSGKVYGGHLIDGTVRTTAEVVVGSLQHVHFGREMDPATGFDELVVMQK